VNEVTGNNWTDFRTKWRRESIRLVFK
jgi:hypothetical protein